MTKSSLTFVIKLKTAVGEYVRDQGFYMLEARFPTSGFFHPRSYSWIHGMKCKQLEIYETEADSYSSVNLVYRFWSQETETANEPTAINGADLIKPHGRACGKTALAWFHDDLNRIWRFMDLRGDRGNNSGT